MLSLCEGMYLFRPWSKCRSCCPVRSVCTRPRQSLCTYHSRNPAASDTNATYSDTTIKFTRVPLVTGAFWYEKCRCSTAPITDFATHPLQILVRLGDKADIYLAGAQKFNTYVCALKHELVTGAVHSSALKQIKACA